ncbi:hypothetical protein, partial [Bartonella sp. MM55XZML]|uniref:hypothetical protein n=1 Tax=Bartonella sp. MM55XZML TaxID=3243552 RepID=UPI0035D07C38
MLSDDVILESFIVIVLPFCANIVACFESNEPPETVIVELLFANMPVVALVTVTLFKATVL